MFETWSTLSLVVSQLCSDEIYSHPGVPLVDHLRAVATGCSEGRSGLSRKLRYIVGACHDFGKATHFFQEYLVGERSKSVQTNHSTISGFACFFALREAGFEPLECAQGWMAVTRHHSPLVNTGGEGGVFDRVFYDIAAPTDAYEEQVRDIGARSSTVQAIYDQLEVPLNIEQFCEWVGENGHIRDISQALHYQGSIQEQPFESAIEVIELFAQLVAADKLDASGYILPDRHHIPKDAVLHHLETEFGSPAPGSINEYRERARNGASSQLESLETIPSVLSLTLPTGLGKTFTGIHVALQLRARKSAQSESPPRIVYALPYTAIIDQNFDKLKAILSSSNVSIRPETILKHHYRSQDDYFTQGEEIDDETDADFGRQLMLTDRWESEIICTTFVQLLESIVVPSNRQSIKLPSLRDAIVILDEAQAVPVQYWDVVRRACAELAEDWNCTFIAMTATQPGMFSDAPPLVPDPEVYFDALNRVTFRVDRSVEGNQSPLAYSDLVNQIVDDVLSEDKPEILLVCNTVSAAREMFHRVEEQLNDSSSVELEFLSSAVRPIDRSARIQQLHSEAANQRVVVSTQVIEAGVDLSFDKVVRDFAPLDSIVQAAGRCNRHSLTAGGEVRIVQTVDDNGVAPATLIYDSPRLDATRRVLASLSETNSGLTEAQVTHEGVTRYFEELAKVKVTDDSVGALRRWNFKSARMKLIPDTYSMDVFVFSRETSEADREIFEGYKQAVEAGRWTEARNLKPEFFDRVVSVSLYSPDSDRAQAIQKLPFDEELELYYLPADTDQFSSWYDPNTGLEFPSSTVDSRLI